MSRARKRPSGNPAREVVSTGIQIEARDRFNADIPESPPGVHRWVVAATWNVEDPTAEEFEMDHENLLTVLGPLCWNCEQAYSRELAANRCHGQP